MRDLHHKPLLALTVPNRDFHRTLADKDVKH